MYVLVSIALNAYASPFIQFQHYPHCWNGDTLILILGRMRMKYLFCFQQCEHFPWFLFLLSIKCISLNSLCKRKTFVPTVRVGTYWIQYYMFIVHSKCSDLIFVFFSEIIVGVYFWWNSRSVGFPGSEGGLSQSKLNICNLHSRRLYSPLWHFFQFLCTFMDFLSLTLFNSTASYFSYLF